MKLNRQIDGEGVKLRKAGKLKRRKYYNKVCTERQFLHFVNY